MSILFNYLIELFYEFMDTPIKVKTRTSLEQKSNFKTIIMHCGGNETIRRIGLHFIFKL